MLADESIQCLQKALLNLREIWEVIGIPEDQRLQRTEVVKKHIKVSAARVSLRWDAVAWVGRPLPSEAACQSAAEGGSTGSPWLYVLTYKLDIIRAWCYLWVWVVFFLTGPRLLWG